MPTIHQPDCVHPTEFMKTLVASSKSPRWALRWEHLRTSAPLGILSLLVSGAGICGCRREDAEEKKSKPPEVYFDEPVRETVTEYQEFTGQTMAKETVEIRSRVSGYLDKTAFKDGDIVEKGSLLFQ